MAHAPRTGRGFRGWLLGSTALLHVAFVATPAAAQAPTAGPTGGQVVAGQAAIAQDAARTVVTQGSQRAVVDWQRFDVGREHTVRFQQPNAQAWTLNRVRTPDPSQIAGRIEANGGIAIVNPSGIVFAEGAQVDVGALIASAPGITTENFMAGRLRFDQRPNPGARVENRGRITVREQGLAVLAGPRVANSGVIEARLGRIGLAGAEAYTLDLAGDGLLSIDVTGAVRQAPDGTMALVTNDGLIIAEGGTVRITAEAASGLVETLVATRGRIDVAGPGAGGEVRITAQGGDIRLDGTIVTTGGTGRGGRIAANGSGRVVAGAAARLDASGGAGGGRILVGTEGIGPGFEMAAQVVLEQGAVLRADATRQGQGGTIALNSRERTDLAGEVTARGGPDGGDGGFVELSGQGVVRIALTLDLTAPQGQAGTLLLDPNSIRVVAELDPPTVPAAGDPRLFVANTTPAGFLEIDAASVNAPGIATVVLQAKDAIEFAAPVNRAVGTLTLQADGTITQTAGSTITAGSLVIRGFAGGTTAAGAVTLKEGNQVVILDAISKGALAFKAAGPLLVDNALGASVDLTATGTMTVRGPATASAGELSLKASTITVQAAVAAAAEGALLALTTTGANQPIVTTEAGTLAVGEGGTIRLTADAMTLAGTVAAPLGTIAIDRRAAVAGLIDLGKSGSADGQLRLDAAELALLSARRLTLGRDTGTGPNIQISDALTLASLPEVRLQAPTVTITKLAALNLPTGGILEIATDTLTLTDLGDGARLSAPGGTIAIAPRTITRPVVVGATGAGKLGISAGLLERIGLASDPTALLLLIAAGEQPITLGGDVRLAAADGTAIRVETLRLDAGGAITQSAGALVADAVEVQAGGAVTLTGADNAFGKLSGSAEGVLAALSTRGLVLGGLVAPELDLTGGSLTLDGLLDTAELTLTTTGTAPGAGGIGQTGTGRIGAAGETVVLDVTATGTVTLDAAGQNRLSALVLDGAAGERQAVLSVTGLTVQGRGGDVAVTAPDITLKGLVAAGDLTLAATGTGGLGGAIGQEGAIEVGGTLAASALRAILLDVAGNRIAGLGDIASGTGTLLPTERRIVIRSGSPVLALDGVVSVPTGGTIALAADGILAGAGGRIEAPGGVVFLAPSTPGRHVALGRREPTDLPASPPATSNELRLGAALLASRITAGRLDIGRLTDGTITAGSIRHYGADLDLTGYDSVALAATGFIRQRGFALTESEGDGPGGADGARGALRLGALELRAGGEAWLGADNKIGALALAEVGGTFTLRQATGTALAVTGPVGAGGRMTLIADSLPIDAGLRLSVPGGVIELLPRTEGRGVTLGAGAVGQLALDAATLAQIGDAATPTTTLRIGASADVAARGLDGWATGFAIGRTDAGALGGGRTAGRIALAGPVALRPRIGGLDLIGAEVTQAAAAPLDVARLSLDLFGAADLGASGNRVGRLAAASGPAPAVRVGRLADSDDEAAFRLVTGGTAPLVIAGDVVALYAPGGGDPATGGRIEIAAPSLDIRAGLQTSLPEGAILSAGAVRTDTGLIRLQATAGDITQQDGTGILAARFAALAEGAIALGSTGNLILALVPIGAVLPNGAVAPAPDAALAARGGDVTLATRLTPAAGLVAADRALVVDGTVLVPAGIITGRVADAGTIEAGGAAAGDFLGTGVDTGRRIRLVADDMAIRADLVAPGGEVALDQAGTTPGWEAVRLRARANADEQGLFLDGTELGRIVLDGALVAGGVDPLGLAGGGRITLSAAGDFLLTESLVLPGIGELRLEAPDGSIIQQSGTISVRALSAFARDSITLDLPGNAVARLRDIHALTGDVTLRIGAVPVFSGADPTPVARLAPGRDLLDVATGGGGALRVTGTSAGRGIEVGAGRTITLRADDLDIRAPLLAPGGVVRLLPLTAGRSITLGDAAQGAPALRLFLSAAELARVDVGADGRLEIGATGTTPAGRITLGAQALDFGRDGDPVQSVGRLDLAAGIAIEQTAGTLRVEELTLALDTANRRPFFIQFSPGVVFPILDTSPARIALGGDNAIGRVFGASLRVDPAAPGAGVGHNTILLRQAAGEALDIAGPVALTEAGGRITLVADALTLGGTVTAPGAGRIEILPRTAGTAISLGTATGGLGLPADALAKLSTGGGVLRFGRSADALAAGLSAGRIRLGGALDLTGIAAQLELYAGMQGAVPGTITQTGPLTVARLAGEAAGAILLDDPANRIGALAPREAIAPADAGLSLRAGTADADAALAIATAEPQLRVDAAAEAGTAGGRLTLRADDMAIAAPLRAPGGTVDLAPLTADGTRAVRLGSAGSGGALHLSGAELRLAEAATLEIGRAGTAPGSGSGPLTLEADIDLREAPGAATPFAARRVRELRIATGTAADGTGLDATQTAGRLNVEVLSGEVAGSVRLDASGNPINVVRGLSAGGDLALRFGGLPDGFGGALPPALDAAGNPLPGTAATIIAPDPARQGAAAGQFGLRAGAGGEVRIAADGLVIQPIAGAGAPATLQAPGGIVRLSAASAGRAIVLGGGGTGALALSSGSLAAIGGAGAGGTTDPVLRLRIGGATAGPITVAGPVSLREASLPDGTPGAERVRALELASGGAIVGGGTIRVGAFAAAGTAIDLTAAQEVGALAPRTDEAGAALPGGLVATQGALRFGSGLAVTIGEDVTALGDVTLGAAGDVAVAPGVLVDAGGALRLEAGGSLTIEGPVRSVGAMRLSALGDGAVLAILGGPVEAGGTLVLFAPAGSITQDASGRIVAGSIDAGAAGGIVLDQADNETARIERAETAAGDVRIRVTGALQVAGAVSAPGEILIDAGGDLSLPGAVMTGDRVALTSAGAVRLSAARITTTGGELAATAGTELVAEAATLDAAGAIRLTAATTLRLLRTVATATGDIELRAGGLLDSSGSLIEGASVLLLAGGDLASVGDTLRAAGALRMEAGGGLTLESLTAEAETAEMIAGADATLAGVAATIGAAWLVAAPDGIAMTTPVTLRARDTLLPIALFDTRADGFRAIPDVAQPDTPGLQPLQQQTQVLRPDTGGAGRNFGLSRPAAAGNIVLALDAEGSPVFLLIDGANVAGDIIAGRLGIHGVGGEARLFGSLGGFPGQAAARFGDVTRFSETGIVTPPTLSRYRINECVISSLNCVNPNLVILLPTPPPPIVDLITDILARDPDAVLPNVSEEEF
jgi:filamentous hemagglutinin family protein